MTRPIEGRVPSGPIEDQAAYAMAYARRVVAAGRDAPASVRRDCLRVLDAALARANEGTGQ